ncbi:putative GMC oxidoreductase [Hypoxylon crocopeplum]|nr:putative GMC oxidoreductase [Hypoxylon crocopeplum]
MWTFSSKYPIKRLEEIIGQTYDYIVVGGGTAGSALASRLGEGTDATVLLLERGSYCDGFKSQIPLVSIANGDYAVHRMSTPESGAGGRPVEILSAETLGGTSRMNGMIYTRGAQAYYDLWSQSASEWSWADVEPFFKNVERTVSLHQTSHLESDIYPFLERSANKLGLLSERSVNKPGSPAVGHFNLDLTIDPKGCRQSALHAYLPKAIAIQRQDYLHICTDVIVSRLDLDPLCGLARGVFVHTSGARNPKPHLISARREIVLTAGAICSPQILQLSGIGPRPTLESMGIPVVRDLQGVGSHLGDHPLIPVSIEVPIEDSMQQLQDSFLQMIKHAVLYLVAGKGWLKSALDRGIFFNTSHLDQETGLLREPEEKPYSNKAEYLPDAEIIVLPIGSPSTKNPGKGLVSLQLCLLQLRSTGSIQVTSLDATESPQVKLNMMHDPEDREVARKALRFTLHLAEEFVHHSGYPKTSRIFYHPGNSSEDEWNEDDWRSVPDACLDEYIEKNVVSSYHLTSSCHMASEEEGGVVDGQLRVHGFKNLRISDASVLPSVPLTHPMAAVYMVAERCADFIKKTWS